MREKLTNLLKDQLRGFYEYLKSRPTTLGAYTRFSQPARLHALNQMEAFMSFKEWIKRLKEYEIPFPIKKHGSWREFPEHEDQVHQIINKNLIKGGKHALYSVIFAKKSDTPIFHMENKKVKQLEEEVFSKKTKYFLTDGIEDESEDNERNGPPEI